MPASNPVPRPRPATFADRLDAARAMAAEHGVAALLLGVGADLRYLTGYAAMPLERLTMLVVPARSGPFLVAPRLEAMAAESAPAMAAGLVPVVAWDETDDPHALVAARVRAAAPGDGRVLVGDRLWAMHVLALEVALRGIGLGLATPVMRELRMTKDAAEVELLRRAATAADRVVEAIAAGRLVGRTEADVATEVRDRLVAEGHEVAEFAIVAAGENSASPHHEASDRRIRAGEPIVLDIGGTMQGYCSDTTRTLWVTGGDPATGPDPEFLHLVDVLVQAQAAATAAVAPGVPCERIDAAARDHIAAAGFGPQFLHRVGHGIGLETHEEPYLVAGNDEPLRPGMAFSVEPGIYVAGRHGARIEDIVVCGEHGPDVLNQVARSLRIVTG